MHKEERRDRSLTDEDVEALAIALEERIAKHFFLNVGKGVLGFVWKGALIVILALAAYGAGLKNIKW